MINKIFDNHNLEIKTIEEIATEIYSGNGVTKNQLGTGGYPAIKAGDINSQLPIQFTECISFVDHDLIKKPKYFEYGDVLISNLSNKLETLGKSCVYLGKKRCLAGNHVIVVNHQQNPKYLAYALSSEFCRKQIEELSQKGTVYDLFLSKIKQIKIPIPPKDVQDKVVDYLDKFYELEAELRGLMERELEDRKKQYEYYKDQIFHRGIEEFGWEIKLIEEIATEIYSGNGVTKNQLGTGDYPAIRYAEIHKSKIAITKSKSFVDPNLIKKQQCCETGDILFAKVSENLEESGKSVVYDGKEKCLVGNNISVIKHNQNPKYLAYALSSEFCRKQIEKLSIESTVFCLYPKTIKQIKVPMPEDGDQDKVSEILDKFHTLTEDIISGIPGLIKANRKKYEYCRDRVFYI